MGVRKGIGELLIRENFIELKQLEKARQDQKQNGGRLTSSLVKLGFVSENELAQFLGDKYNVPTVDLNQFEIDKEAIELVSKSFCEKHTVIPVSVADRSLVVAFADPTNVYIKDDLGLLTRRKIEVVVAAESAIMLAVDRYYSKKNHMNEAMLAIEDSDDTYTDARSDTEIVDETSDAKEGPIIRFVNAMLSEAIKLKASDIHIEPYEKRFRIRFRIDGNLMEKTQPPAGAAGAIVSRVKVMSKLDIAERRRPQDGRLKVKLKSGKDVDFRVSCLPTMFGEKIVMRILDKSNLQVDMEKLGFEADQLEIFKETIALPQGMILITGPTGSGKTTTIYSALAELNKPEINLSTAEDPVEFNLDGINQVQVNPDIGFGFAEALKSFLRQDPDVIMVGEIRDGATSEIAYKAASTGHLVVSTLHTNDSAATISRLIEMGVPSYIVAESTSLVIAQRLIKKNCSRCSEEVKVSKEVLLSLGVVEEELGEYTKLMKGNGCAACNMTGLSGRMAIFEVMPMLLSIRECILKTSSPLEIKRIAIDSGVRTLRQSALKKLSAGVVCVEEVLNVTVKDDVV